MWMTPNVPNGGRSVSAELVASKGTTADGEKRTVGLESQTKYWATPDCNTSTYSNGKMGPNIREQATSWNANSAAINSPNPAGATDVPTAKATAWPTPKGSDGTKGGPNQAGSKGANSEQHALVTGGGRKHMDQLSNFVAHSSHLAQPMPDGPPSCESGHGLRQRLVDALTQCLANSSWDGLLDGPTQTIEQEE
jgi:hypothetical protein